MSKFSNFDIHDGIVFGNVQGTELKTAVLVPKGLEKGKKAPVLVHWHGGGFMTGQRLFEPWFARWFLQLAESTGSIIVCPDYRLLPESTSDEMLDDMVTFFSWLPKHLPASVSQATSGAIDIDLDNIAVGGESAGGSQSVLSPLLCPDANIKAVICQYGPLDFPNLPWYNEPSSRPIMGLKPAPNPDQVIEDYLTKHVRCENVVVRTESEVADFWPICVAHLHAGRFAEALGLSKRMRPMELLDEAKSLPPIWFVHGSEDSIVQTENTWNFVEKVKKVLPQTPLHVTMEPGEHGFDGDVGIEEGWVQDGLKFFSRYWPLQS